MPVLRPTWQLNFAGTTRTLPTKKLHKLLYYCQGHHLAATGESLFSETISAWDMGPVVGTLWFDRGPWPSPLGYRADGESAEYDWLRAQQVRKADGRDLERLTHAEMPWRRANQSRLPGQSSRIGRTGSLSIPR